MPLALAVTIILSGFYLALKGGGKFPYLFPAYLALAGALLLKGPIGAVLPATVAGVYLFSEGELPLPWHVRRWASLAHRFGLWWGIPLVLCLVLPWYLWANAATGGEVFRVFFWHHNVDRFSGSGGLRAHPWWLYGPYLASHFLPWSLLLPVAAWYTLRRGLWRADPLIRFGGSELMRVR